MRHLLIVLLCLGSSPALAWWQCDWRQRFSADIDAPPGPPVNNALVRLDLDSGNVPATFDWSTNGSDLRLVAEDDTSELVFFIEQWDSLAETAVVQVRIPRLNNNELVYLYFDGPPGASSASSLSAAPQPGMKFHTRRSTADPTDLASAQAAFESANANANGYGCASVDAFTNLSNRNLFAPPNRDSNIALFAEVFFDVTPATAGTWAFRYGADFGFGGGLYVDDVTLEEAWNTDLWWNYDWNNSSEVLEGSINLGPGTHSLRIIGFENCCDGGLTAQFRRPGGAWEDLALANIDLRAQQCSEAGTPAVTYNPVETGNCPDLDVTRTSAPLSDPVNGTVNPKAIPGAVILNTTTLFNSGTGLVDAGTLVITERIDSDSVLMVTNFDGSTAGPVQFVDGVPSSGLSYTFTSLPSQTDDLAFSNDGGLTFDYVPSPDADGVDPAVTNFRLRSGSPFAGDSGAGPTSVQFRFKTRVR